VSDPSADIPKDLLREWAATLKHDLGKYVAWRSANLSDSAWSGALDELAATSIRDDILATRDAGGRREPAWELFDRLAQPWPRPWPAELEAVQAAVAALRELAAPLQADDRPAIAAARDRIRTAQSTIRTELAALHRRLTREV
jgi:hypothetical protein